MEQSEHKFAILQGFSYKKKHIKASSLNMTQNKAYANNKSDIETLAEENHRKWNKQK